MRKYRGHTRLVLKPKDAQEVSKVLKWGAQKLLEVCNIVGGDLGEVGVALEVGVGVAGELHL
jgi:hypothetical protein